MAIATQLSHYISEEILGDDNAIDPDQNLLGEGVIDSLGMLRVAGHIEIAFGVKIPPEHYLIENFRSLNCIARYVVRRLAGESE